MTEVVKRVRLVALLIVFGICAYQSQVRAALPSCDVACDASESCTTECEYPVGESWVFTICGEYDGGPSNGWCGDPVCEDVCSLTEACTTECYNGGASLTTCGVYTDSACSNSCDVVCSALSSGSSDECTASGGGSTTCGSFGVYLNCGDDICAPDEMCGCSADCAAYCPVTPVPEELVGEIPQEPTFNAASTIDACQLAVQNGWGSGWDCPTWEWLNTWSPTHPACAAKQEALNDVKRGIDVYKAIARGIELLFDCETNSTPSQCATAIEYDQAAAVGVALYESLQAQPCYMFQ